VRIRKKNTPPARRAPAGARGGGVKKKSFPAKNFGTRWSGYYYPDLVWSVSTLRSFKKMDKSRKRNFVFTINNYSDEDHKELELLASEATWLCYGEEEAPTTGTPHIQGCVTFANGRSLQSLAKKLKRARLAVMLGTFTQNEVYCSKGKNVVNIGVKPMDQAEKGQTEIDRWEGIWTAATEGRMMDIPAKTRITSYNTLQKIASDHRPPMEQLSELKHEWLVGPPGTGKSWAARAENPVIYLKNSNKWWCGYNQEPCVLIEEIELDAGKYLGHFFKIWCDIYPFIGEVKHGKTSMIRPAKIVVTSNYSIGEVFAHDPVLAQAILRRFNVRRFLIKYQ